MNACWLYSRAGQTLHDCRESISNELFSDIQNPATGYTSSFHVLSPSAQ